MVWSLFQKRVKNWWMPMDAVWLLSLPTDDVFLPHILCYFDPFEAWKLKFVCKDFYSIIYRWYSTSCHEVKLLTANISLHIANQILSHCFRLQRISINGDAFGNNSQCTIETCLLSLSKTSLSLKELSLRSLQISQKTLTVLRPCCKTLQKISLFSIVAVANEDLDLTELIKDCTALVEYHSDTCSYQLQQIMSMQKQLKVLELRGYDSKMTQFQFETFLLSLSSLQTLSLSHIPYVSDKLLLQAIEYCSSLNCVKIFHCPLVSWKVLNSFRSRGITTESNISQPHVQPTSLITINQI